MVGDLGLGLFVPALGGAMFLSDWKKEIVLHLKGVGLGTDTPGGMEQELEW